MQRSQRLQVEGQFDAPEAFAGLFAGLALFFLELHLQRYHRVLMAHGHLHLPGRQLGAIRQGAGLRQARQLMGLQAGDRRGGKAQQ